MKKTIKKIAALLLAGAMAVGITAMAGAQTVGNASEGTGSIVINNAAKGETYGVVKLFDARVNGDGGITYTGTIPEPLKDYFEEVDEREHIVQKKAGVKDEDLLAAVQAWADTQSASVSIESDGSALTFAGLAYGYYAVKSTQGTVITIDSTNPNATVYDKNSKTITVDKKVDEETWSIGDTITYTATFDTVNYLGEGEDAKQVINYDIQDTLPDFLSDVTVTSITVGDTPITTQQFANKTISIPWATEDAGSDPKTYTNLYKNGAKLVITYTAKLTAISNTNAANTNTVSIHPTTWNGKEEEHPWDDNWQDDAVVRTYAAAIKKVDGTSGESLARAEFTIKGLTVEETAEGVYTVVSYNPADNAEESAVLKTDKDGMLYIFGLDSGKTLTVTEYKAPDGYNKLDGPINDLEAKYLTDEKVYKTSGTIKYDAKGNVISASSTTTATTTVEVSADEAKAALAKVASEAKVIQNFAGTELPSTGGMGTTIFYVIGGILVLAAVIVLISKRRVQQ